MFQQSPLERRLNAVGRQATFAGVVEDTADFAIQIELELIGSGIANACRRRFLVSGQPFYVPFFQLPFSRQSIHDLHLVRTTGHRTHEPLLPLRCLGIVATRHESKESERGIAQPAEAVIPVACTAKLFRQRSSRSCENASGGRISQRFQGNERTLDCFTPWPPVIAALDPVAPEGLRFCEG